MARPVTPPSLRDDARRLLELLHALASAASRPVLRKWALDLDLTHAHGQVLRSLRRHPRCLPSEVARAVTVPAMSQRVDRLATKRLDASPGR